MVSMRDRIKSLEMFEPYGVLEILDENNGIEYLLTYDPKLGAITVESFGGPYNYPLLISHEAFASSFSSMNLNDKNWIDRLLIYIKDEWEKTSEDLKMSMFDNAPLNSSVVSGVNI